MLGKGRNWKKKPGLILLFRPIRLSYVLVRTPYKTCFFTNPSCVQRGPCMVGGASVAAAFARGLLSKSVFAADAADVYEYMGPPHLPPSPAPSSLPEGRGRYSGGSMVPWGISERGRDEGRGASASCVFPATNGEEEKETLSHSNSSCLQGRNEEKRNWAI